MSIVFYSHDLRNSLNRERPLFLLIPIKRKIAKIMRPQSDSSVLLTKYQEKYSPDLEESYPESKKNSVGILFMKQNVPTMRKSLQDHSISQIVS